MEHWLKRKNVLRGWKFPNRSSRVDVTFATTITCGLTVSVTTGRSASWETMFFPRVVVRLRNSCTKSCKLSSLLRDYSRITQQLLKIIDVLVDVLNQSKRKRKKQAKAKNLEI